MIEFLVALAVTLAATAALLPVLQRKQVLDHPNARSSHTIPVPRGGGLAVVAGIVAAVLVSDVRGSETTFWLPLLLVTGLAAVGFADDLASLSGRVRLGCQLIGGAALAAWIVSTSPAAMWPAPLFTLVAVLGFAAYVNAFNFMDGINGISGVVSIIAGLWFAWLAHGLHEASVVALGLAVAGASLGFLPWNAPRARVFLGDVGSYALGSAIATMALYCWAHGATIAESTAPLLVYLADTAWALIRRSVQGADLSQAHREHVYQRLVDGGFSHTAVAAAVGAFALVACLIANGNVGGPVIAWSLIGLTLGAYVLLPTAALSPQSHKDRVQ